VTVVPAIAPALLTLCGSLAMAGYLFARRHKEMLHWMLLGFLAGLVLWTGGLLARFTVTTEDGLAVSLRIVLSGILFASAFWLLTAIAYVGGRAARLRVNPGLIIAVVSSLFALALFTNDGHRLFLRKIDFTTVTAGPPAYAGPVFWVFLVWAYGCVGTGMALYLHAAHAMLRGAARRRGILLAIASAVPPATSTLYVFQLLPIPYDQTPIGLLAALVLLSLAIFRYQLLESLPIAREAVLAHLDDGVVMASAGGRITDWNPAAERILGASALRRGGDLGAALAPWGGLAEQPCAVRMPDGRLVEVTTAIVDEGRGEPAGRFAILSDRSAVDRAEQLARQTQRLEMVGALAGEVALQINDPLTFVRASLVEIERLGMRVDAESARGGPDAELAEELADLRSVALETLEGVERIRRIVDGMRDLSSLDRVGATPVDLNEVVREALRMAQLEQVARSEPQASEDHRQVARSEPQASEDHRQVARSEPQASEDHRAGPAVTLTLAPMPPVRGNADRLVQVVLNLVVNARQALAHTSGARIEVETRASADELSVEVRDNGPGIPETVLDRVFDPFFTTRGPDEGTGLGLAIAFDIAREHGGALEASSPPGQGARFVLRLPVRERAASSGPGGVAELDLE
jgi:signal transduction histidine kinase